MPLKAQLFQIVVLLTALLVAAAECTRVALEEEGDNNPLLTQSYHLGENGRVRVELVPDRKEYRYRRRHGLGL